MVRAIAPFHGRVLVLDRDDGKAAAPHGAVLPTLIHGGPGRAGGGEELGGIRGVLHQMQATSVAGPPDMLVAVTGTLERPAPRRNPVTPTRSASTSRTWPSARPWSPAPERSPSRTSTPSPSCPATTSTRTLNEVAAAANPLFGARVAHGYLVLSAAAGLFVDPDPGPVLANFGLERLRFVKPVYLGDTIGVRLTVKSKTIRPDGSGEVTWDVGVTNADGELVASYDLLTINARRAD